MSNMTRKELTSLGWRIDKNGKAAKVMPTKPIKKGERIDGVYRTKLERDYARELDLLKAAGVVMSYHYEPIKIRYTQRNEYQPDFVVKYFNGLVEIVECKGYLREDDSIKCHAAATIMHPWKVVMVRRKKQQWVRREF